jgi:gamma-glutamyltranspeptidase/glutathione hydrolase
MDMKKAPDPCPTNPPRLLRREFLKAGAAMGALVMAGGASAAGSDLAKRATAGAWKAVGMRGAVAGGGVAAVEAANAVIERGGNAADAAATMLLAMTVTDSSSFCFGGEAPIIYHDGAMGRVEVIAGMGTAPKLATLEHFKKGIPRSGPESAAVPAALDAILTLLRRHGTLTFAAAAGPAMGLLHSEKLQWHTDLAATMTQLIDAEKAAGDRAAGLRAVADCFYRGPVAAALDKWSRANGGLIRAEDLAAHVTRIEEPVMVDYRGFTVCKCGPWTQGPCLLEALKIIEGFDVKAMGRQSPEAVHVTVEALKLALADRDVFYADPLFESVPLEALLSGEYAAMRRMLIDMSHASLELRPGDPVGGKPLLDRNDPRFGPPSKSHDTTTCVAADAAGNFVAATPSGWSGALAGSTGVWLNSRLQSFNNWPHSPNRVMPGKRPRITLTPTLLLKAGRPVLAISVAGGDGQDQTALQLVMNYVDFGLAPDESVTVARFGTDHHIGSFGQTPPSLGSLSINPGVGEATIAALKIRDHKVRVVPGALWSPCVLQRDETGQFHAAGDPRAGRHAAAN